MSGKVLDKAKKSLETIPSLTDVRLLETILRLIKRIRESFTNTNGLKHAQECPMVVFSTFGELQKSVKESRTHG